MMMNHAIVRMLNPAHALDGGIPRLFHFPVAIRYAESEDVRSESDVASTMLMLMRHRWQHERSSLLPLLPEMIRYCEGVISRVDSMVLDRNIEGNMKGKYERFLRKIRTEQCTST
jgi:hypothetical protein